MKQGSRPTLKAIAKELGVSVTTVSRSLNGKAQEYGISSKTEEAVRKAAKRLNFSPDQTGRKGLGSADRRKVRHPGEGKPKRTLTRAVHSGILITTIVCVNLRKRLKTRQT